MTLAVLGATGQLGQIALDHLAARGVGPTDVFAIGRNALVLDEPSNAWYTENHRVDFDAGRTSTVVSNIGEAPLATATRGDLAEAAAITLAETTAHRGVTDELSGETAWTYHDLAREASAALGMTVTYQAVGDDAYAEQLAAGGLDDATVGLQLAVNANPTDGLLGVTTPDLTRLLGRPTTPLGAVVASWAAQAVVYGGTGR